MSTEETPSPLETTPIPAGFRLAAVALPVLAVLIALVVVVKPRFFPGGGGGTLSVSFMAPGEMQPRSLDQFAGRVLVVTLWSVQTPESQAQIEALRTVSMRHGRDGLVAVALTDEGPQTIANYAPLRGAPVLAGRVEKAQADALAKTRPFTWVIDRAGKVRKTIEGAPGVDALESIINSVM